MPKIYYNPHLQEDEYLGRGCCNVLEDWAEDVQDADIGIGRDYMKLDSNALPFGLMGMKFKDTPHEMTAADNGRIRQGQSIGDDGIVLGPVIGLVTSTTARILIEHKNSGTIRVVLAGHDECLKNEHVLVKNVKLDAGIPKVVQFNDLRPSNYYSVSFGNTHAFNLVNSRFKTMPAAGVGVDVSAFGFAVVSGNTSFVYPEIHYARRTDRDTPVCLERTTHPTHASLWKHLYDLVCRDKIRYVFHLGHNILLGGSGLTAFTRIQREAEGPVEAVDAVRALYHEAWNEPWTKHVLANCPNIMVPGELDIGNLSRQHTDQDWLMACVAFQAARCYQVALSHPVRGGMGSDNLKGSLLTNVFARLTQDIAVLTVDWRTQPTFINWRRGGDVDVTALLGKAQKSRIEKALTEDFAQTKALIVLSTSRLCDNQSFIYQPPFAQDPAWLVEKLFDWRAHCANYRRQVLVISTADQGRSGGYGEIHTPMPLHFRDIPDERFRTISEICVSHIAQPPWLLKKAGSWFRQRSVFYQNQYKFCDLYDTKEPCFAKLTIGHRLESTNKYEEAEHGKFLVSKPIFWIEGRMTAWRRGTDRVVDLTHVDQIQEPCNCGPICTEHVHSSPDGPCC